MRCTRKKLVHIFIFFLLFSSSILFSNLASAQLTSSWTASSSGTIRYSQGIHQLKISIDFTGSYLTSASYGYDLHGDGCDFIVGTSTPFNPLIGGPMSNTVASIDQNVGHNQTPCLYLADASSGPARAEFNIYKMETKVGNEVYVSNWYYFPSNWTVPYGGNYAICDPVQCVNSLWAPILEIWIHQSSNGNFTVTVGGERADQWQVKYLNKDGTYAEKSYTPSQFPRGRWFNIQWWLRRDPTPGYSFIKFWFDGSLVCDQTAFPYEGGPLNYVQVETSKLGGVWPSLPQNIELTDMGYAYSYFSSLAKDYHGGGYIHQLWTDDLKIWDGKP